MTEVPAYGWDFSFLDSSMETRWFPSQMQHQEMMFPRVREDDMIYLMSYSGIGRLSPDFIALSSAADLTGSTHQ